MLLYTDLISDPLVNSVSKHTYNIFTPLLLLKYLGNAMKPIQCTIDLLCVFYDLLRQNAGLKCAIDV